MPVVPTYQPQVREQPLEGGFQRAPDTGANLARASQALSTVANVADQIDLRNAQTRASETEATITSEWLKWDAANRQKYRGAAADGYAPAAEAWWKTTAETFGKDLDPRARALASQTLMARKNAAMGNVINFTAAEKERHADEAYNADVGTTIQFAVTAGDVASGAQQIREKAAQLGARKGWTTEQVQAEQQKNLSAMHLAQITKLAETNAEAAQKYYDANKAEVGFQNQARVEQVLKGEADNQFATQFAAQQANKPLSEQLAEAAKIQDPQRREKTITQVRNNFALVKQAEQEREAQFSDQAWQLASQGRRVPEAVLAGMNGRERAQLVDWQRARAERAAAGTPVKTNPEALARVYDLMRDDPEAFKKLRMVTLTEKFAPSDIEQISRIQRDMLKPDTAKDVATTTQLMATYTGGWKPEKRAGFESAAYDELARFEKEKGRPANFDEKRKLFDRMMLDGEVLSGSWFLNDPNKKLYEATREERKRFAPTITSDDRKLIKAALQAEGIKSPTEAQITERFKLAKGIK